MDDKDIIANHRKSLLRMGMVATSMEDFASQIIRHVFGGGELNDAALGNIKAICIRNLKNSQVQGMPINQETEAFREAVGDIEKLMDGAIVKARGPKY